MTTNAKYAIVINNFNFVVVFVVIAVYYIWHGIISGHWFTTAGVILLILIYFGLGRIASLIAEHRSAVNESEKIPGGKNG